MPFTKNVFCKFCGTFAAERTLDVDFDNEEFLALVCDKPDCLAKLAIEQNYEEEVLLYPLFHDVAVKEAFRQYLRLPLAAGPATQTLKAYQEKINQDPRFYSQVPPQLLLVVFSEAIKPALATMFVLNLDDPKSIPDALNQIAQSNPIDVLK